MNTELHSLKRDYSCSKDVIQIVTRLVEIAYNIAPTDKVGLYLAATFDLMVAAEYYNSVTNRGWTYCNSSPQMMFYTYTNICPRCIGNGKYVFAKANKPESGSIGRTTTEILCLMYQHLFLLNGHNSVVVYKASEPVDVIICDEFKDIYVLAEVKAAPLITLPLAVMCEPITQSIDGEVQITEHGLVDNAFLKKSEIGIYFPKYEKQPEKFVPLAIDWNDPSRFYKAILNLVENNITFYLDYIKFWEDAYKSYIEKDRNTSIFWLTNACGAPSPIPDGWPRRKGTGYESVSDSKTSAGMDRTDDIKKGIYQVLKLGADYKTRYNNIKTAIISNLPATRHFDEYLLTLKDIIWAVSSTSTTTKISDLPLDTPVYNLFDGILSFTKSEIRDSWIQDILLKKK